jgi:hypothetical protein
MACSSSLFVALALSCSSCAAQVDTYAYMASGGAVEIDQPLLGAAMVHSLPPALHAQLCFTADQMDDGCSGFNTTSCALAHRDDAAVSACHDARRTPHPPQDVVLPLALDSDAAFGGYGFDGFEVIGLETNTCTAAGLTQQASPVPSTTKVAPSAPAAAPNALALSASFEPPLSASFAPPLLCCASSDGQPAVPSALAPSTAAGCCTSSLASAECWTTTSLAAATTGLQPAATAARVSTAHEPGTNGAPTLAPSLGMRNVMLVAVLVLMWVSYSTGYDHGQQQSHGRELCELREQQKTHEREQHRLHEHALREQQQLHERQTHELQERCVQHDQQWRHAAMASEDKWRTSRDSWKQRAKEAEHRLAQQQQQLPHMPTATAAAPVAAVMAMTDSTIKDDDYLQYCLSQIDEDSDAYAALTGRTRRRRRARVRAVGGADAE